MNELVIALMVCVAIAGVIAIMTLGSSGEPMPEPPKTCDECQVRLSIQFLSISHRRFICPKCGWFIDWDLGI